MLDLVQRPSGRTLDVLVRRHVRHQHVPVPQPLGGLDQRRHPGLSVGGEHGHPHAVLLDVAIPKIDGIEVAGRLSTNRANLTPLIVTISGFGPGVLARWGGRTRVDLHMVKPVDPEQLRTVLDRFKKVLDGIGTPAAA